jgi:hypothetical protein
VTMPLFGSLALSGLSGMFIVPIFREFTRGVYMSTLQTSPKLRFLVPEKRPVPAARAIFKFNPCWSCHLFIPCFGLESFVSSWRSEDRLKAA